MPRSEASDGMSEEKIGSETNLGNREDVLAEAEIYLAYQMKDQAIAVLEEALGEGVAGLEDRVRLVEIYAAEGNMDAAREHAVTALGQLSSEDEALRSRIVAVDPAWSQLQAKAVEAIDAGVAEVELAEGPEPTFSTPVQVTESDDPAPIAVPSQSESASRNEKAEAAESKPVSPAVAQESGSSAAEEPRRLWRRPLIVFGGGAGVILVLILAIRWLPVEIPSVAGVPEPPEPPVHAEAVEEAIVQEVSDQAVEDGAVELVLSEINRVTQIVGHVLFRDGGTEVSAGFDALLDEIAGRLVADPGSFAEIVGYSGGVREDDLGKPLARQVGQSVANQLIRRGVAPVRLRVDARTGADLVADGWVIEEGYSAMAVIHLQVPSGEALP